MGQDRACGPRTPRGHLPRGRRRRHFGPPRRCPGGRHRRAATRPAHPRSEVSWGVGQPTAWDKNPLGVTQDEETKMGVEGEAPSALSASARPGLGISLPAFALWGRRACPLLPTPIRLLRVTLAPAQVRLLLGTGCARRIPEVLQHRGQGPAPTHGPWSGVPSQGGHPSLSLQPGVPPESQAGKSNAQTWTRASRIHLRLLVVGNGTTTHSGPNPGGAPGPPP